MFPKMYILVSYFTTMPSSNTKLFRKRILKTCLVLSESFSVEPQDLFQFPIIYWLINERLRFYG
ncbi:hypothetical protein CW304_25130 [Bacillus sp. UFRGS-B20]|nr:hypothetical protein CW304_25130 [Bacillus sp. UFRGS-B20]